MNLELVSMWAERHRSIFILLYVKIQYSQNLLIGYFSPGHVFDTIAKT